MTRTMAALAAAAVLFPAAAPAASRVKDVELPPFERHSLENGLTVYLARTGELPLVTFRLLVPAGSARDGEGREGLASMTAGMLLKGAGGMTAEEISAAVEGVGGRLDARAGRDYTIIEGDFLARDLDLGLDLLATALVSPSFPEDEFDREKGIVLASLRGIRENPYRLANREFLRELAAGSPYGDPVGGYVSTVEGLDPSDLEEFHGRFYRPEGSILAVVGDIEPERLPGMIGKKLGGWKGKVPEMPETVAGAGGAGRRIVVVDKPGLTQSQIRIGSPAEPMASPGHFELTVANSILGGGFTSRLMDEIRVERGLSYGARSYLLRYESAGYFGIYTYTKNETLGETIDVALDQVRRIREERVPAEELEGSKRYISGLFPFEIETDGDIARWMTELPFYGLGPEYVEGYRSRIASVSAEEVRDAAIGNFLAGGEVIVLVTDYEKTAPQIESLGDVEVVKFEDLED